MADWLLTTLLIFLLALALVGVGQDLVYVLLKPLEPLAQRAYRWLDIARLQNGVEAIIGQTAMVVRCHPQPGRYWVDLRGETWQLDSEAVLQVGDQVTVTAVDGLMLSGEPVC